MRTGQDQAFMMAFAAEVKSRRSDLKISQEELAARAEVNRTYVGKIELARNQPTLVVSLRIAQGLEIDLPTFITAVMQRYAKELKAIKKGTKSP